MQSYARGSLPPSRWFEVRPPGHRRPSPQCGFLPPCAKSSQKRLSYAKLWSAPDHGRRRIISISFIISSSSSSSSSSNIISSSIISIIIVIIASIVIVIIIIIIISSSSSTTTTTTTTTIVTIITISTIIIVVIIIMMIIIMIMFQTMGDDVGRMATGLSYLSETTKLQIAEYEADENKLLYYYH